MKYPRQLSNSILQKSFHLRCSNAADVLAEEKPFILQVGEFEDSDMFLAMIRVFLCRKYGYSAINSAKLIEEYLQVSKPYNLNCISGRF